MQKQDYFDQAIAWAEKKALTSLKANYEGYESPKGYINRDSEEKICPDISFITQGGVKHYTDIALKQESKTKLVSRWKLFSLLASAKKGKLYLLAPKGHKRFTQDLIAEYNIPAVVHSL